MYQVSGKKRWEISRDVARSLGWKIAVPNDEEIAKHSLYHAIEDTENARAVYSAMRCLIAPDCSYFFPVAYMPDENEIWKLMVATLDMIHFTEVETALQLVKRPEITLQLQSTKDNLWRATLIDKRIADVQFRCVSEDAGIAVCGAWLNLNDRLRTIAGLLSDFDS